ncbi:MAG: TraB/GumN family protein [Flavobacteriales bacterium]|nr:TraB/GumN family protein [Flavobacteriales bacterium]
MNNTFNLVWCKNIFIVLLIFLSSGSSNFANCQENEGYNLLWQIDKKGQNTSYVFGTMHVRDNRAFNFTDSVMLAIEACDNFAIELHPDSVFNSFMEIEERTELKGPKELLNEEEYKRLIGKFEKENNLDIEEMGAENPLIFKNFLSKEPEGNTKKNTFVDAYLLGIAKTLKKQIYGLERFEDQMGHFYNRSEEAQRQELLDLIEKDHIDSGAIFDHFVSSYGGGNLDDLNKFVLDDIYDPVMVARNDVMANSIERLSKKGALFSAIGAAHLIGKESVLEKLREKGFQVRKVSSAWTGVADNYSIDAMKMEWKTFQDQDKGFSLQAPGNFVKSTDLTLSLLDMHMLFDISGRSSFMFYSVDLRNNKEQSKEEDVKKRIQKYFRKNSGKTAKTKKLERNGLEISETTLEAPDGSNVRFQIFMANDILYCLGTFSNFEDLFSPEQEKFFSSFKYEQVDKKETESEIFVNEKGAFEISFKNKPTYKLELIPNPLDHLGEPYEVHMFTDFSASSQSINIVTYNDFPPGYYLDDDVDIYNEMMVEMQQQGTIDQEEDTITIDGVEGLRFRINMQGTIPMNFMFFYRGNRLYKVISSGADLKAPEKDEFLNSIRFLEPKRADLKEFKMEEHGFSMDAFQEPYIRSDSSYTHDDFALYSDIFSTTDPYNGGAYFFDHSKLNELFKIQHLDTFYNSFEEGLTFWNDSIYKSEDLEIDGNKARRIFSINKYDSTRTKYVFWIDGDHLNTGYFYVGSEFFEENRGDDIFQSYRSLSAESDLDIYSSKAQMIIDGLNSGDTTLYNRALGSFSYYEWDENERAILLEAMQGSYPCDTSNTGARSRMIAELANYDDIEAIRSLEAFYASGLNDVLKEEILSTLNTFSDSTYIPVFVDLFISDPPKKESSDNWDLFSVFQDSIDLVAADLEDIIGIHAKGYYQTEILQLINRLASTNDNLDDVITKHYDGFMERAIKDLDQYKKEKAENGYAYSSGVSNYLELLNNVRHERFAREYTPLFNDLDGDWIQTKSYATRIMYDLPIAKSVLKKKFKDQYSRYDMISAYYKAGKSSEIPSKYSTLEELANTFMNEYLYSQDEYPDKQTLNGTIEHEKGTIYVFDLKFDWNDTSYLGLCGPFPKNGSFPILEDMKVYSDWEEIKGGWKDQATKMIPDLFQEGYLNYDRDQ